MWMTLPDQERRRSLDLKLNDRLVCVTGGTRGIGHAAVVRLLEEGAIVSTGSRSATVSVDNAHRLGSERLFTRRFDVLDPKSLETWAKETFDAFGQVHGVVCNAGYGEFNGLDCVNKDSLRDQFAIKVESTMNTVKSVMPYLASDASIVVINAISARSPDPEMVSVSVSRSGLAAYTDLLATSLARRGIRVNTINLGVIATDRQVERWRQSQSEESYDVWLDREAKRRHIPLGRVGSPAEVGDVITYLLSDRASYVTRSIIDVSGGL